MKKVKIKKEKIKLYHNYTNYKCKHYQRNYS